MPEAAPAVAPAAAAVVGLTSYASQDPPYCAMAESDCDRWFRQDRRRLDEFFADLARRDAQRPPVQCDPAAGITVAAADGQILQWWGHVMPAIAESVSQSCPVKCTFVTDPNDAAAADAHVRVWANRARPPAGPRPPHQRAAVLGIEFLESTDAHAELAGVDILVTVSRRAHVPVNYAYAFTDACKCGSPEACRAAPRPFCLPLPDAPPTLAAMSAAQHTVRPPPGPAAPPGAPPVLASAFVSNCVEERRRFLERLFAVVPTHSFGECLRSPDLPPEPAGKSRGEAKLALLGNYPFYFAFDNSLFDGYVTEKVIEPLIAGSVPVVWSAPDSRDVLPEALRTAVVDALAFESPEALGRHLLAIAADEALYAQHFAWRKDPALLDQLQDFASRDFTGRGPNSWACRLCQHYASTVCGRNTSPAPLMSPAR